MTMTKTEMWAEHNRIRDRLKEVVKDQTAEIAELWNFVEAVANEKGTPTTWGTVYREAQEMVRNREITA
jgi:hypothetical protein